MDDAVFACQMMPETRPFPILRLPGEAANDWVSIHVTEFFDAFLFGADVEIIIARQPKGSLFRLLGDRSFQGLDSAIERSSLRFGDQEMNVFRHGDITEYKKDISSANLLQGELEKITRGCAGEIGLARMATEGEEMKVACFLVALELKGHASRSLIPPK